MGPGILFHIDHGVPHWWLCDRIYFCLAMSGNVVTVLDYDLLDDENEVSYLANIATLQPIIMQN